jgi:hypothetical protein
MVSLMKYLDNPNVRRKSKAAAIALKVKMLKNNSTVFIICLALFNIATGCSKSANIVNTEVTNTAARTARNGNTIDNQSGINPSSSPSGMPVPDVSPRTVQVRLTEVETNADMIDSPLSDSKIMIETGATNLNKQTNDDGVVLFESVPCGSDVVITAVAEEGVEDAVFHRKLECKGPEVDLGVIVRAFGGKYFLEQRKPQAMGYDVIKEVWQTMDGKIVPDKEIRRILSKYNFGSN